MTFLTAVIKAFLESHFVKALRRDPNAYVRPVFLGPPLETIESLYHSLTSGGTDDWYLSTPSGQLSIAVLLVRDSLVTGRIPAPIAHGILSRDCTWDYAVTVRNSRQRVIMLVDPPAWSNRPESLANTTETLGSLRGEYPGRWFGDDLWKYIIQEASTVTGQPRRAVRSVLTRISREGQALDHVSKERAPWEIADALLSPHSSGLSAQDSFNFRAGLPPVASSGLSMAEAIAVVDELGQFLGKEGVAEGITKLAGTKSALAGGLQAGLDGLRLHIEQGALSGANFADAPSWYYRPAPGQPAPPWWLLLDAEALGEALGEADERAPGRLELRCENALNKSDKLDGEPFIVTSTVDLKVRAPSGATLAAPLFSRKVPRSSTTTPLASLIHDDTACVDSGPVPHEKPLKYQVDASGFRTGSVDVLVLESFACHGSAHVRDAERNRPPEKPGRQTEWRQEILLPRSGPTDVAIYHSTSVANVQIAAQEGTVVARESTVAHKPYATFVVDVENDDEALVTLEDHGGSTIGMWVIHFTVEEVEATARSRFESLVSFHQRQHGGKPSTPVPPDTPAHRIESSYIQERESWRPVLACWSTTGRYLGLSSLDWGNPQLGDISPQFDPRPVVSPPLQLLEAREAVRQYLAVKNRLTCQIELDDPSIAILIDCYLKLYTGWLDVDSEQATWFDCIAVHAAQWNAQAGAYSATPEPVVMLLSPLHPLRLGWHCVAQQQLVGSRNRQCPAAGVLDPNSCPDAGTWHLSQGGRSLVPRGFLAVPCDNPHWSILWNKTYLNRPAERELILIRLRELGLESRGIAGGFTRSQAVDCLGEATKLLPSRATLRVGIIGTPESSSECADGIIEWCEQQYAADYSGKGPEVIAEVSPLAVEIYDVRGTLHPSPEKLATLSEKTGERVRWFKVDNISPSVRLDLIILDQLNIDSPSTSASSNTLSPLSQGALFRIRVREDVQNAIWLKESRIGVQAALPAGLPGLVQEATIKFEELARKDSLTQFEFQPNQQAIGTRLDQTFYLAVTSSQLDPACIIRGAMSQQGYLWDYELPGTLGGDEESAGYYLIAKPPEAVHNAIERSAGLVTPSPPPARELLDEISRRGIPVLKRLASGGSHSRGELGLLLAIRLLQDAFRPSATPARLPILQGNCIHLLLPVDPYEEPFERIRLALCKASTTSQRPDMLVFAILLPTGDEPVQLKVTPVEVKFRNRQMPVADLRQALGQASNLGQVLGKFWAQAAPNDLWTTCGMAMLSQCLDLAFRIYADEDVHGVTPGRWAEIHQRVLEEVLGRRALISVIEPGRLLVFDSSTSSSVTDMDGDGRPDTAIISPPDAEVLLTGRGGLSAAGQDAVRSLNFSFLSCGDAAQVSAAPSRSIARTMEPVPAAIPDGPADTLATKTSQGEGEGNKLYESTVTLDKDADLQQESAPSELQGTGSPVTAEVRRQVREAFEGYVGNENALRRVTNDLLRALIEKPPHLSKNFLFTGQPSTGKTEIARRISRAIGLPFVKLDGRGVGSRERLLELVDGELAQQGMPARRVGDQAGLPVLDYPPLVVFIDEVHLMPRVVQESLLTLLEAADRTVSLADRVARMNKTTFLFATTRSSDLDSAFRSRCALVQLREYTVEEVADILGRRFPVGWPRDIYLEIAKLGRSVPRVAIMIAEELQTEITVSEHQERLLREHLDEVRRALEIDEIGLTPVDMQYLSVLEQENKAVGEQLIINLLGTVDKDRVVDEVEPFLRRLGFIKFGTRGREITPEGRNYLLAKRRGS